MWIIDELMTYLKSQADSLEKLFAGIWSIFRSIRDGIKAFAYSALEVLGLKNIDTKLKTKLRYWYECESGKDNLKIVEQGKFHGLEFTGLTGAVLAIGTVRPIIDASSITVGAIGIINGLRGKVNLKDEIKNQLRYMRLGKLWGFNISNRLLNASKEMVKSNKQNNFIGETYVAGFNFNLLANIKPTDEMKGTGMTYEEWFARREGTEKTNTNKSVEIISQEQLEHFFRETGHFQAESINLSMINELNKVLIKYDINTSEEISMFLSTVAHESKTGLVEVGVGNTYVKDGVDYRGGGYTQLTGYSNYKAFATQMLEDRLVELDEDGNNPITSIGGGAEYIKVNFAWEAAGWHWVAPGNNINKRIEDGENFYKVSQVINGGPNYKGRPNGWEEREEFYNIAKTIF